VDSPEYHKGIDLCVLLLYSREDQSGKVAAECPAGVWNDTCHYQIRQRFSYRSLLDAIYDFFDTQIVLGGIELPGDNRFSRLHNQPPITCICGARPLLLQDNLNLGLL
jgi:hypothetical protein